MDIFRTEANYAYFLKLYFERIGPMVDTYCWVLMKNHFHLMVRIKTLQEIFDKLSTTMSVDKLQKFNPSRQFANFFISYARAFNIQEKRRGGLLERPFCRKEVNDLKYFKDLVIYIHRNPIHHGVTARPGEYEWSSYQSYFSVNPSPISKQDVLSWFDSTIAFKQYHRKPQDVVDIEPYIIEPEKLTTL
jgi:REP element-mobilizing transposase RayT